MKIIEQIDKLKKDRKAIILSHNYQVPEVQDAADFVGDSLALSIQASKTDAEVIVFCGVHFMAETAKILSPGKTVLIPDKDAGCPMANMITAEDLRKLKAMHPGANVLCYVNTTADVKAECDLCCTSANAVRLVEEVLSKNDQIIFVPDQYLAHYVSTQTGRDLIPWKGYCPTHAKILPQHVMRQKREHPTADLMVHPECKPGVIALADAVLSTEAMCRYARESKSKEIIVATETGILHRLKKENPEKVFYPAYDGAVCPNMKRITLEKVLWSLEDMKDEVLVPAETISRARTSIERMLKA